jgi:hypothetical protein
MQLCPGVLVQGQPSRRRGEGGGQSPNVARLTEGNRGGRRRSPVRASGKRKVPAFATRKTVERALSRNIAAFWAETSWPWSVRVHVRPPAD